MYHCAPPNSTIRIISKIREKNEFKLITEIGDMWPETMPVSDEIKKLFFIPLSYWKGLRDKNLNNSDVIIAECNLFKKQLEEMIEGINVILVDERLTTVVAENQLLFADVSRKKRKQVIDKMAAVAILQGYLDRG